MTPIPTSSPSPRRCASRRFAPRSDPSHASRRHLVLRRWDGIGDATAAYGDTTTPQMNLGDGVHIQFGGSNLIPGDYWQFVTRSADGSVQSLFKAPPRGIVRYYCPLAVVKWSPVPIGSPPASPPVLAYAMQLVQDCRNIFSPLTQVPGTDDGMRIAGLFALNAATGGRAALLNDQTVALWASSSEGSTSSAIKTSNLYPTASAGLSSTSRWRFPSPQSDRPWPRPSSLIRPCPS